MVEIIDSLLLRLLVAFGIGALIGLEREQAESGGMFAGSRTFPLFALTRTVSCVQLLHDPSHIHATVSLLFVREWPSEFLTQRGWSPASTVAALLTRCAVCLLSRTKGEHTTHATTTTDHPSHEKSVRLMQCTPCLPRIHPRRGGRAADSA
ncbi:hypothetical protein C9J85_19460 [Haloferax sp. wsp5]|nr:hypothetical protein C9J85_19460 [Haloferax sp. wsp5]